MPITFRCQSCHKDITALDAAAGRRGKCPFCGQMNDVPLPPPPPPPPAQEEDDDMIPLAPLDEEEEQQAVRERHALYEQESALLDETGSETPAAPLDQREELDAEELHHFVVNFCLEMSEGKLQQAAQQAAQLKRFAPLGIKAVEDFVTGKASEPALNRIPRPVLQAFLKDLRERVL
jgi:phage FluMu protein Com